MFKRGDTVQILSGSYRGEVGMVIKILPGDYYRVLLSDREVEVPQVELTVWKCG